MKQAVITQKDIDGFIEKLPAEGKKQSEISAYKRVLDSLHDTVAHTGGVLTKDALNDWKEEQLRQGAAPGTVTNRIVKVDHFLRYLGLDELCFPNGGRQDLAGKRFGDLIAIEPSKDKRVGRSICWRCRCALCGTEKEIPANQLIKGAYTSCGCRRASRLQETNGYVDGTSLKNVLSDKVSKNNTSGYKGVFMKRGKWTACIQYKKKRYYLGSYDRQEDAVAARKEAEILVKEDAERLLEQFKD